MAKRTWDRIGKMARLAADAAQKPSRKHCAVFAIADLQTPVGRQKAVGADIGIVVVVVVVVVAAAAEEMTNPRWDKMPTSML